MHAWRLPLLGAGILLAVLLGPSPKALARGNSSGEPESKEHEALEAARVPNKGAVIHIVSPADGFVCPAGMDIEVCVELQHSPLGQNGNHWHISVDGEPWIMIEDDSLEQLMRGLPPGEHKIEVLMADGEHRDLEQGDAIRVVVR